MADVYVQDADGGETASRGVSKPTILLHWIVGLLVLFTLSLGLYMTTLPNAPAKFSLYDLHNSVGICIFGVALVQIYWRFRTGWPSALRRQAAWEHAAKRIVQWTLVIATLALPISGILSRIGNGYGIKFFGQVLVPFARVDNVAPYPDMGLFAGQLHYWGGRAMIAALLVHLAATAKHHLIDRDQTLVRMFGLKRAER